MRVAQRTQYLADGGGGMGGAAPGVGTETDPGPPREDAKPWRAMPLGGVGGSGAAATAPRGPAGIVDTGLSSCGSV